MTASRTETMSNGVGMRMLAERPSWEPLGNQVMLRLDEDSHLHITYRRLGVHSGIALFSEEQYYCLLAFCRSE